MINDALRGEKLIGMIQPELNGNHNSEEPKPLSKMGCVGVNTGYRQCKIEIIEDDLNDLSQGDDVDRDAVLHAFKNYLTANNMDADWDTVDKADTETLITALCMMSPYDPAEKQALLEAHDD